MDSRYANKPDHIRHRLMNYRGVRSPVVADGMGDRLAAEYQALRDAGELARLERDEARDALDNAGRLIIAQYKTIASLRESVADRPALAKAMYDARTATAQAQETIKALKLRLDLEARYTAVSVDGQVINDKRAPWDALKAPPRVTSHEGVPYRNTSRLLTVTDDPGVVKAHITGGIGVAVSPETNGSHAAMLRGSRRRLRMYGEWGGWHVDPGEDLTKQRIWVLYPDEASVPWDLW